MKMEHKHALADGSTYYDADGIFTIFTLDEEDINTGAEVGGTCMLTGYIRHKPCAIFTLNNDVEKRSVELYWSQLGQEGAEGFLPKEPKWQPPKTKAEAACRMMAGEVFCWMEHKLYFNGDRPTSPFHSNRLMDDSSAPMTVAWDSIKEFTQCKPEPKWDDNLSEQNPVWCWVSDESQEMRSTVMKVIGKDDRGYIAFSDHSFPVYWGFAEPCSQLTGVNNDEI